LEEHLMELRQLAEGEACPAITGISWALWVPEDQLKADLRMEGMTGPRAWEQKMMEERSFLAVRMPVAGRLPSS
jgi:hypothetical protein